MRFTLGINLDRDEIERDGIDAVLVAYLADIAIRVASGAADAGTVLTENGAAVGRWITDDDGEYDLGKPRFVVRTLPDEPDDSGDDAAQFRVTTPDHVDTDSRPLPDDGDSFAAHAEGYR